MGLEILREAEMRTRAEAVFDLIGFGMALVVEKDGSARLIEAVWQQRSDVEVPSDVLLEVLSVSAKSLADMPSTPFYGLKDIAEPGDRRRIYRMVM
jgi:hypothetical protein